MKTAKRNKTSDMWTEDCGLFSIKKQQQFCSYLD